MVSTNKALHIQSHEEDSYEMVDPQGGNLMNSNAGHEFDMRKYKRSGDSPSIFRGSEDGVAEMAKTTKITVQYTSGEMIPTHYDGRSCDAKHASVDSLV